MSAVFNRTQNTRIYVTDLFVFVSRKTNGSKSVWSEEQEDELQRLYDEFKDIQDAGNILSLVNSSSLDVSHRRFNSITRLVAIGVLFCFVFVFC